MFFDPRPGAPQVRADITFFPIADGGGVFSTGSIAWVCALSHANYQNNMSQLTGMC